MQELTIKKQEIIKVNGKRFCVRPSGTGDVKIAEITEQDEKRICKALLSEACARDFNHYIPWQQDANGVYYFTIFSQEKKDDTKYYLKYLREIKESSNYGLEEIEGGCYLLYFNDETNDIEVLSVVGNKISKVEGYKDKLLDGLMIK